MSHETKAAKPDYQVSLRQKAADVASRLDPRFGADEIGLIYEALREAALESWKNGLQAGRKRTYATSHAAKNSGRPTR